MKGRGTAVVSIRLSDSVYTIIKGLADKRGMTVSAFIKLKVEKFATDNAISKPIHSVNQSVNTINPIVKPHFEALKQRFDVRQGNEKMHSAPSTPDIPIYDPTVHKAGDRVLVRSPYGRKKLKEMVIPELDVGGQPIY